jgi:uncharacterized protein
MGALNLALEQSIVRMRGATVYVDTNPIIYIIDQIEPFADVTLPFFTAIADGQFRALTGEMTLGELLTKPYADNNTRMIGEMNAFFDEGDFVRLVAHNKDDFVLSAQLRGTSKLKAIDALHVATAINHQCAFFITADKEIAKRAQGVEVVNLNDFL